MDKSYLRDMYKSPEQKARKTIGISILSNFLMSGIKLSAGIFGSSFALIADGIESLADLFSSILTYLGLRYSSKPADDNHPYGHGRIEPLITFGLVLFLVLSACYIAVQSIHNMNEEHPTPSAWTLSVLAGIILWKEVSFRFVRYQARQTHSTALSGEAWHHRSDAITSIFAFVGIGVIQVFGPEYAKADDLAALLASGVILYNSYKIFRPALGEIMDEHMYDDLIEDLRTESLKVKGIKGTEKCFVRKVGMRYHIDLHAMVDGQLTVTEGHSLAHNLQDHLKRVFPHIQHVHIHIEPDEYGA